MIQFGPFITTTIFGMIIIIVVPVLTAYFVSKAYREERDRGSLIFIVTKKDHKSLIYFSKYISAIMAT